MNMEQANDKKKLVETYYRHCLFNLGEDFWAWNDVMETVYETPEQGWKLILEMLQLAPSSVVISHIAAGPLENLLRYHGEAFIDRVRLECTTNIRLREALSTVLLDQKHDVIVSKIDEILSDVTSKE